MFSVFCDMFSWPCMAAENNLVVAYPNMKCWLLRAGIIYFLLLEGLPEGYFCSAEVVWLITGSLLHFTVSD